MKRGCYKCPTSDSYLMINTPTKPLKDNSSVLEKFCNSAFFHVIQRVFYFTNMKLQKIHLKDGTDDVTI